MLRYALNRLLRMVPVLLGVLTVVFLIMRMAPGDPARAMLGEYATPETVANLQHKLGLDKTFAEQYATMVIDVVRGDFGTSFVTGQPAMREILRSFPFTLHLAVASTFVAVLLSIPLGILCAYRRNKAADYAGTVVALTGISMPSFWVAILLILVFAVWLGWLPAVGAGDLGNLANLLHHLVLPAIAVGMSTAGLITRMVRSCMLEVLNQDFIRTARAKGLREPAVAWRHAIRNALIPVITVVGLQFGKLLGGLVVVEVVFARPGLGKLLYDAILTRDYPQVQATVLFFALLIGGVNMAVDMVYALADPRLRTG